MWEAQLPAQRRNQRKAFYSVIPLLVILKALLRVIFSLMKVTSSVFFALAPTACCAPESTWLEKLQSTAFLSVDKTCRQAHA